MSEPIAEGSYEWYRREVERLRAELEQLRAERDELKRVTEPPADGDEMPTDPAELREMWEFINRQARWQWHMAHKFGSQVERVRALHSPEESPYRVRDCKGCRTDVSFVFYDRCKTLAALAIPSAPESPESEENRS